MARKKSAPNIIHAERWHEDRRCIRGARVSEARDRGHTRISEDVQDAKTGKLAEAFGLETVSMYAEIGVSGDAERAALEEAIVMIEQHRAAWLVVAEVDRLGRDVRDIYNTFHRIHAAGGCVLIGEPLMNSADENSRIVLNLLASLAESQRYKIARKWSEAQANAWERGIYPGDIPFGYRNPRKGELAENPGQPALQVIPEDKALIRTVVRRIVEDSISWPIAGRMMNRSAASTRRLFNNRTLLGEIHWGDRPVIRDAHEAILTVTEFETINGRRVVSETARQNKPTILGAGVLRCAGCRYILHKRPGTRKEYYCRTADCKLVRGLPLERVDELLWQAATEAHTFLEGVTFGGETDTDGRTIQEVDGDLNEAKRKRMALAPMLAADPDDELVRESMDLLKREIKDLQNERTALQAARASLRAVFMLEDVVVSVQDRNEAVRSVLDAVFVAADGSMFPHPLGTYTEPLPSKGRSVPRAPYVPTQIRATTPA